MTRRLVLHPVLVAVFPILSLYSVNVHSVLWRELVLPLVIAVLTALVTWGVLAAVTRRPRAAALMTTVAAILFWAYHPAFDLIDRLPTPVNAAARHSVLLPVFGVAFVVLAVVVRRRRGTGDRVDRVLDLIAACLVAVPVVVSATSLLSSGGTTTTTPATTAADATTSPVTNPPDVYYIVLDAYGRADVLERLYGIEHGLAERLSDMGFYVAERSTSNYPVTLHSLPSALNYAYVDELVDVSGQSARGNRALIGLVRDSRLVQALRPSGYVFVAYSSGYYLTECPNADDYIRPSVGMSEFQAGVFNLTPLEPLQTWLLQAYGPYELHRRRILECLDSLPSHATNPRPTFVFAHLLVPHQPFVFGPAGEDVSPYGREFGLDKRGEPDADLPPEEWRRQYVEGYKGQVEFLTNRLSEVISEILERSPEPPVIIIQGDHGPAVTRPRDPAEQFPILNAYYLSDEAREDLYPSITPVNSFRIVLNGYFGHDLPLLPDKRFKSGYADPHRFEPLDDAELEP